MPTAESPRPTPLAVPPATACEMIGISRTGLYRLARDGEIALLKIGSRTVVRTADLQAYLDRLAAVVR
jgi:excisionase family DNA binding protein